MGDVVEFPHAEPLWREAVGEQLRAERLRQERTLVDVAGRAGISTQYLSEIERGRKEPSSEILGAVAGALGLRVAELAGRVSRTLAVIAIPPPPPMPPPYPTSPNGPLALAR